MKQYRKTVERINETKSLFFGKISKNDKPLVRLTRENRAKIHISNIRNSSGITIDSPDNKATL